MPMHQTDNLFHKAKASMCFIFGGEADNHAFNTVPKKTLIRITKAEDGGMGGVSIWFPATTGFTPNNESEFMQKYIAGELVTLAELGKMECWMNGLMDYCDEMRMSCCFISIIQNLKSNTPLAFKFWNGVSIMKRKIIASLTAAIVLFTMMLFGPNRVFAHCDGLDGPVVKAAQKALETKNVNLVLIWVQKKDEAEIRTAFEQTLKVRKLGPEAKQLADMYFFETLVRIHRAGEGAPYMGLKPAGRDLGPAIPAGDKALETGAVEPLLKLLTETMHNGLHEIFTQAMTKKNFNLNDVENGREYVKAYVEFIHYVEGLYEAAKKPAEAHFPASDHVGMHEEGY